MLRFQQTSLGRRTLDLLLMMLGNNCDGVEQRTEIEMSTL